MSELSYLRVGRNERKDVESEQIERAVEQVLGTLVEGTDVVVEQVRLRERGADTLLEVTVDRKTGIESLPLEEVAELSRSFSAKLDEVDPVPGQYQLEVGTPGAESELKTRRHFERNLGRVLRVRLRDGEKLEGELCGVGPDAFNIRVGETIREVAFTQVRKARPRVAFS